MQSAWSLSPDAAALSPWALAVWGVLGAVIGSFLSVVVVRLPLMLQRQWAREAAAVHASPNPSAVHPTAGLPERFNLALPGSRAPCCGQPLRWHHMLPLVSFALQGGRCTHCHARMAWLYPGLELSAACLFVACGAKFGPTWVALMWGGFGATLLALACIDWQTTLLPDDLTLPLLWAGLIAAALGLTNIPLKDALWGAVAGYLSLWGVYWAFKLVTGKEGMGYGDFKLFAALGAWFGWPLLIPLILLSSVVGAVVGIAMKFSVGLREGGVLPFGPFLSGAGLLALMLGPDALSRWVLP